VLKFWYDGFLDPLRIPGLEYNSLRIVYKRIYIYTYIYILKIPFFIVVLWECDTWSHLSSGSVVKYVKGSHYSPGQALSVPGG